ncbi:hypothetical protein [uncultured Polaribacter sp.]|uniref:hypothetical protein n=1 Tax=uncultured Polaribacter sp. TaxID=174711 RepID=UPI0026261056|nr:hypothetical protein [uncultured Polaribacter sp.]
MKKLTLLSLLLISLTSFCQSPWTQEKGNFYTQVSFNSVANYDTLFGDPDTSTFGIYTDNTAQIFAEYGISNKTSLLVNLPLKIITIEDFQDPRIDCDGDCSQNFSKTALGNIEIGIKHNFYKKGWLLSGQISVEANTGTYDGASGIRTGYDAYTFTPLFLTGKGFGNSYFQAFIGANIRTNNYSSNFKIGGEYGKKITEKIWLIGYLDIVKSLKNGTIILPVTNTITGFYVNDQEFGGFGLKTIGEFTKNFGITAGFGGAFFANNLAQAPSLNIGAFHKF